ncbi:MAG: ABC transporter permease [Fervidicoccaceae archaeon]
MELGRLLRRLPTGALSVRRLRVGLALLASLLALSATVALLSPYDPTEVSALRLRPPMTLGRDGWPHVLGTDNLGRDVLTRTCLALFLDVGVGLAIVAIAGTSGLALGMLSGFVGGAIDGVLMRIMDVLISIPGFMLAIAIAALLGSGLWNAVLAVALVTIPIYARLSRGVTLSIKENLFVLAAREAGLSRIAILRRHVLPHVLPIILTQAAIELSNAILYVAALSFIGLGAQEPTPEWGLMMSVGRKYLREAWWFPIFPGIFMFMTVLSFNLIGDGLRDHMDPKRRLRA